MQSCLVCDDHAMMRGALAGAISMTWPEATVSTAADFSAGWAAAAESHDLILCDLSMPGATPLDGISGMREAAPDTPLVVVTANEDDSLLLSLFDLGIAGFIPKSASAEIIEMALRLVLAGGLYLPPRIIALANARLNGPRTLDGQKNLGMAHLTDRQLEVLTQLAAGESNKEIARRLGLSPATVKTHVASILSALNATNRTEAVYFAREAGAI
jgi:two-component system, NarL family, nitrate/nitrite response regulator NarL